MTPGVAETAAIVAVAAPAALVVAVGLPALLQRPLREPVVGLLVRAFFLVALAALGLAALRVSWGRERTVVDLGVPFAAGGFRLAPHLVLDALSLPVALFAVALCGLVGGFAHRYMHREPGYTRFFVMLAIFALGIEIVVLAGGLAEAFVGWELIGLASALLVAFFQERPLAAGNGLRVFAIYRVGDVALLAAAILVHRALGATDFDRLLGAGWPDGRPGIAGGPAVAVTLLLLLAAMVKCGQWPFASWLPRAMEGPTPSSAIFYGALSVHAGAYLLLRCAPLLDAVPVAAAATVMVGATTAVFATVVARAQTDIKSALAFASLTQVGVIVAEIGLGFRYLALVHIMGHACLRSLQFLRAPSILHDLHEARNAIDAHTEESAGGPQWVGGGARRALYRFALERGRLDAWIDRLVVEPLAHVCQRLDGWERRWCGFCAGDAPRPERRT